jgi:hypothetical protein
MIINEEQRKELIHASKPLMEWLRKNCHPHVTAIVDSERAEVLEGFANVHRQEWVTTSDTICS